VNLSTNAPSAAVRPEMMPVTTVGIIMSQRIHPMLARESGRWLITAAACATAITVVKRPRPKKVRARVGTRVLLLGATE